MYLMTTKSSVARFTRGLVHAPIWRVLLKAILLLTAVVAFLVGTVATGAVLSHVPTWVSYPVAVLVVTLVANVQWAVGMLAVMFIGSAIEAHGMLLPAAVFILLLLGGAAKKL